MSYTVAALYKFVSLPDHADLRVWLKAMGEMLGVKGTLLLAQEGLNGTVAGSDSAIRELLDYIRSDERLADLDVKYSEAETMPFLRFKVRLKKEIVTIGDEKVDPTKQVGTYVDPSDWNAVISDPDTIVIDTRNDYEVEIGTFRGAVNPDTKTFREFPAWVEANRERLGGKRVAMFCTGGIRCEKASSFMLQEGFADVLHLKGGILKYLETQPEADSLWDGDCFVFDQRVAVSHGLRGTDWTQCFACRTPLSPDDLLSEHFEKGVSCNHCYDKSGKARFRERQKQMDIAASRQAVHLGR